jgi:hypothetical protein
VATLYTEFPRNVDGHRGERALAELLDSFDAPLHLWFCLDFVPGVADIDVLLLHEDFGLFVVEAKCVNLTAVKSYELGTCFIGNRPSSRTPLRQALGGRNALIDYFNQQASGQLPFVTPTACWPLISRESWNAHWVHPQLIHQAEGMIFTEDLASADAFNMRLSAIAADPAIGARPGSKFKWNPSVLKLVDDALTGRSVPPTPLAVQRQRLSLHGDGFAETKRDYPVFGRQRVHISGQPGSGKTHRLIQVGLAHAAQGADALFLCYNKTLAADVRRLVTSDEQSPAGTGSLVVYDIFDLLIENASVPHLADVGYDEWAHRVVARMATDRRMSYSTILIDEAQDLSDWAFLMVETLVSSGATIVVASGPGQALYRAEPAEWLTDFKATAVPRNLRRNFRNAAAAFLAAQAFYETAPDAEAMLKWRHWPDAEKDDTQLGLDLMVPDEPGLAPRLVLVDTPATDALSDDDPQHTRTQLEEMSEKIEQQIREELDALGSYAEASDLMVLVPSETSFAAGWAREALQSLKHEDVADFLDMTSSSNRRLIPRPNQIRLCTFHSSRGLEAERVLVVGFHELEYLRTSLEGAQGLRNLGYIVLSRARVQTTVLLRAAVRNPITHYMHALRQKVVAAMHPADSESKSGHESSLGVNHQQFGYGRVLWQDERSVKVDFGTDGVRTVLRRNLTFL